MSKVDRNAPKRSTASDSTYSVMEFMREFPDDRACLDWLWRRLYSEDGVHALCPKCGRERGFHRVAARPSYSCDTCGHHLHPTAGTIFHKSATSLHLWFYAIFLMSATRCGISAKQLEREIGVTYKTAWRMFTMIRSLLREEHDGPTLGGEVELDETAYGGKPRASLRMDRQEAKRWSDENKTTVFAAVERGGRVRASVVPDRTKDTLHRHATRFVRPESIIFTDEFRLYGGLGRTFAGHFTINHSDRIYAQGNIHTQTVDGFFSLVKRGISGVYHAVGRKNLQSYVDEYAFRYNHRNDSEPLFKVFLSRVQVRPTPAAPARPALAS